MSVLNPTYSFEYKNRQKGNTQFDFKTEKDLLFCLRKFCNPKCKKCFGVGHKGKNLTLNKYMMCECINEDALKMYLK